MLALIDYRKNRECFVLFSKDRLQHNYVVQLLSPLCEPTVDMRAFQDGAGSTFHFFVHTYSQI